jgi:hypothetical protein
MVYTIWLDIIGRRQRLVIGTIFGKAHQRGDGFDSRMVAHQPSRATPPAYTVAAGAYAAAIHHTRRSASSPARSKSMRWQWTSTARRRSRATQRPWWQASE